MAKINANSIWGKFVQKEAANQKDRTTSYREYIELCTNPTIKQSSLTFERITGDLYWATYVWEEDFVTRGERINPYLGASVTGWARVILQRMIRKVDALYCDTDSATPLACLPTYLSLRRALV